MSSGSLRDLPGSTSDVDAAAETVLPDYGDTQTRRFVAADLPEREGPPSRPPALPVARVNDPLAATQRMMDDDDSSLPTLVAKRSAASMLALERITEAAAAAIPRVQPRTLVSAGASPSTAPPSMDPATAPRATPLPLPRTLNSEAPTREPYRDTPIATMRGLAPEPAETTVVEVPVRPVQASEPETPEPGRAWDAAVAGPGPDAPISAVAPTVLASPSSAPISAVAPTVLASPSAPISPTVLAAPATMPAAIASLGTDATVIGPRPRATFDEPETSDTATGPLVGRVLAKRYRLDALVESSARGVIYRGEHLGMHKRVAIKIVHPAMEGALELFARLEREAIAGAHIEHPNVGSASDLGDLEDGARFLVLEYVRGRPLRELIEEGPLSVPRALHLARQLAAALDASHEMGVIHRNVSPDAILIVEATSQDGTPSSRAPGDVLKLVDFGFADVRPERVSTLDATKAPEAGGLTRPGAIVGSPAYLPPEAALGLSALDAKSDLYALGAVLFAMLAGRAPSDNTDLVEHFRAIRTSSPTMLAVPVAVNELLTTLLAPFPGARPASASAVVRILDEMIGPPSNATVPPPAFGSSMPAYGSSMPAHDSVRSPLPYADPSIPPAPGVPQFAQQFASGPPSQPSQGPLASPVQFDPRFQGSSAPASVAVPRPGSSGKLWLAAFALAVGLGLGVALKGAWKRPVPPVASSAVVSGSALASTVAPPDSAPPAVASATPEPSATATASAAATPTAPLLPSVVDVAARASFRELVKRKVPGKAEKAFFELVQNDPTSFEDSEMIASARDLAMLLERDGDKRANGVFDAFANKLGAQGVDVLYEIVQSRGGTLASKRATALLRKPEILARGTNAARLAFQLRDAPCDKKVAMLDEAAQHGDGRTLTVLETNAAACFQSSHKKIKAAIVAIRARLGL